MNKIPNKTFMAVITIIIMAYVMIYACFPNLFQNFVPLIISINIFISAILACSIYLIEHNKEKKRKIIGCGSIAIKLLRLCQKLEENLIEFPFYIRDGMKIITKYANRFLLLIDYILGISDVIL